MSPERGNLPAAPGVKQRRQIRMTDDEVDAYLRGRHSMALGTIDRHGDVHLVAMWYGFVGGLLAVETKAKSQKVQNLRRTPRITVLVETGETYERLRGVQIVGQAEIRDDRASMVELGRSVISRYTPPADELDIEPMVEHMIRNRVAIVVHPERIVSWDHTKLGLPGSPASP
jgi:PPOX class probable F420-dependent enzyme